MVRGAGQLPVRCTVCGRAMHVWGEIVESRSFCRYLTGLVVDEEAQRCGGAVRVLTQLEDAAHRVGGFHAVEALPL